MDINIEEFDKLFMAHQSLSHQIDKLALFIMENIEGEPSQNQGAIDTTIRLLEKQVPKIPEFASHDYYECSSCYTPIEEISFYKKGKKKFKNPTYCFECGQKLDWEGTK